MTKHLKTKVCGILTGTQTNRSTSTGNPFMKYQNDILDNQDISITTRDIRMTFWKNACLIVAGYSDLAKAIHLMSDKPSLLK